MCFGRSDCGRTHISSIGKVRDNTREGENVGDSEPCGAWRPAEVLVSVDIELYVGT